MAYQYLFSGLVKCYCGANYRAKRDRNVPIYICSAYNNYNTCTRRKVEERDILIFVKKFCDNNKIALTLTNEFMKSIIKEINVSKENEITINYLNGEVQEWKNDKVVFRAT